MEVSVNFMLRKLYPREEEAPDTDWKGSWVALELTAVK
jgi:hypothetical protein